MVFRKKRGRLSNVNKEKSGLVSEGDQGKGDAGEREKAVK